MRYQCLKFLILSYEPTIPKNMIPKQKMWARCYRLLPPTQARSDFGSWQSLSRHVLVMHQCRQLTSSSHQNLHTTQGLMPHIYHAFYNAYCIREVLDKQLRLETANLDPLEYGFVQDNEYLVPATSWRILEPRWSTVCNCSKYARASCLCRSEMIK